MLKKKYPTFKNEEEEAKFWDTHSPLDYEPNPKSQKVKVIKSISNICPYKAVKSCVHDDKDCNNCPHKPPEKKLKPMDTRELKKRLAKHLNYVRVECIDRAFPQDETIRMCKVNSEDSDIVDYAITLILRDPDIKKGLELLELYGFASKVADAPKEGDLPQKSGQLRLEVA